MGDIVFTREEVLGIKQSLKENKEQIQRDITIMFIEHKLKEVQE